jgi:hypothetical protein
MLSLVCLLAASGSTDNVPSASASQLGEVLAAFALAPRRASPTGRNHHPAPRTRPIESTAMMGSRRGKGGNLSECPIIGFFATFAVSVTCKAQLMPLFFDGAVRTKFG